MPGIGEHLGGRAGFDDLAEIHHQHAVAQQAHDVEVVADEQVAHAELVLELLQELQDHDLHRDVERRGRLVEDQQLGLDGDGAGDAHPRLLAARELVREARQKLARQAGHVGQRLDAALQRRARHLLQAADGIGDGVGRRVARVERIARVLEHHLDARAVGVAGEGARPHVGELGAGQPDAARGRIEQPVDQAHQRGLAAARFAHQADRLAAADGEGRPRRRRAAGACCRRRSAWRARRCRASARHSGFQHDTTWRSPTPRCGSGLAQSSMRRSQRPL